jgi:hypothetical protein
LIAATRGTRERDGRAVGLTLFDEEICQREVLRGER